MRNGGAETKPLAVGCVAGSLKLQVLVWQLYEIERRNPSPEHKAALLTAQAALALIRGDK